MQVMRAFVVANPSFVAEQSGIVDARLSRRSKSLKPYLRQTGRRIPFDRCRHISDEYTQYPARIVKYNVSIDF